MKWDIHRPSAQPYAQYIFQHHRYDQFKSFAIMKSKTVLTVSANVCCCPHPSPHPPARTHRHNFLFTSYEFASVNWTSRPHRIEARRKKKSFAFVIVNTFAHQKKKKKITPKPSIHPSSLCLLDEWWAPNIPVVIAVNGKEIGLLASGRNATQQGHGHETLYKCHDLPPTRNAQRYVYLQ